MCVYPESNSFPVKIFRLDKNNIRAAMYLLRALPMRVTAEPMDAFDAGLRAALAALAHRLELPPLLPPSALVSMSRSEVGWGSGRLS